MKPPFLVKTHKSTDVIISERNLTIFMQATSSYHCGLTGRLNILSNHLFQSPVLLDLTYTLEFWRSTYFR